jgi:hypothetical protein
MCKKIKRICIIGDIIILLVSISIFIYSMFIWFPIINYKLLLILSIYQIFNLIKTIILFIYYAKTKVDKSKPIKFWIILSIASFALIVLFWIGLFSAFARGA